MKIWRNGWCLWKDNEIETTREYKENVTKTPPQAIMFVALRQFAGAKSYEGQARLTMMVMSMIMDSSISIHGPSHSFMGRVTATGI